MLKMIKLLFVFLISLGSALACPNLTGIYNCFDEEVGPYQLVVNQSGTGLNTQYEVQDEDGAEIFVFKADDIWRGNGSDGEEKGFCAGDTANYSIRVDIANGKFVTTLKFHKDKSGNLVNTLEAKVSGQDTYQESYTCKVN